jgi:hypothetical protein
MKNTKRSKPNDDIVEIDFGSDSDFETSPKPMSASKQLTASQSLQSLNNNDTTNNQITSPAISQIPTYVLEMAKSGRAECKKCGNKIMKDELRVGVLTEGDWGVYTRWQHLPCTVFHNSVRVPEAIDGYSTLSNSNQALVKQRCMDSQYEVDSDMVAINPDELVRKDWKLSVEPVDELLMPLLPYQKEGLGWMMHQERDVSVHGGILAGMYIRNTYVIIFKYVHLHMHECMYLLTYGIIWHDSGHL